MIISPIIIYLIGIVDGFKGFLFFLACLAAIIMLICVLLGAAAHEDSDNKLVERCRKLFRNSLASFIVIIALNTLIPNKNTMIAIISTKYITAENIKLGKDAVIDTVKEIVKVINKEEN